MNNPNPSPQLAETISALMDNEVSELELQRILKATEKDAELKSAWDRYHLARSVLKKDSIQLAPVNFAERISAALENETAYQPQNEIAQMGAAKNASAISGLSNWWLNASRVAVAASVAVAVIIGVQQFQQQPVQPGELVAGTTPINIDAQPKPVVNLPSGINAPELTARTVAVQSGFEARPNQNRRVIFVPRQSAQDINPDEISSYVNELMEVHSDNAARNSGQGVLPFTRVILTENE